MSTTIESRPVGWEVFVYGLRICLGIWFWVTQMIRINYTYARIQYDLSLTLQINLTILLCFTMFHSNITVKVSYNISSAWTLRSLRICPGVWFWMTQIIKHSLTYACLKFYISVTHQSNLTVLLCFVIYKAT